MSETFIYEAQIKQHELDIDATDSIKLTSFKLTCLWTLIFFKSVTQISEQRNQFTSGLLVPLSLKCKLDNLIN